MAAARRASSLHGSSAGCVRRHAHRVARAAAAAAPAPAAGGIDADEVRAAEATCVVGTYARPAPVFTHGRGCTLYDTDGKEYLDMTAGIAVNALGHGDEAWTAAVVEQAGKLAHVSNLYHTAPHALLAKRLVEHSFADRVFFCNSGAEANEAAFKFARKYARVHAAEGAAPATGAVAFTNSFHGRTMGALALTSKVQYRTPFEPITPGVTFAEYGDLESAKATIVKGKTCVVFVEPVQGEGGIFPAQRAFLQGLREICDEAGALLVFDEVQCGLGRTGHLWAHEGVGVSPDMMTVAKPLANGLPIGACLVTEAVNGAMAPGDHGSTFAGGPLVCHAASAVLDRVLEPGFLDNVVARGDQLRAELSAAIGENPHVVEVRGSGLLVGVEMDVAVGPLVAACMDAGVLVISAGKGNVLRLVPPLVLTAEEASRAVAVIAEQMPSLDA